MLRAGRAPAVLLSLAATLLAASAAAELELGGENPVPPRAGQTGSLVEQKPAGNNGRARKPSISEKVKKQLEKAKAEVKEMMKKAKAGSPFQSEFEARNPELSKFPAELPKVPPPDPQEAWVPEGYRAEVLIKGLNYPTSVEFDGAGTMYVAEAGYSYGDPRGEARVLRFPMAGGSDVFVKDLEGPITDLLWLRDRLYIAHRGKITAWTTDGVKDFVTGLPSQGDHQNNQIVVGPDNKLYFGQGTMTNSGVVGPDNQQMGWLARHPDAHDIPARDLELTDQTFTSPDPLAAAKHDQEKEAKTSAFHHFGKTGKKVRGAIKANGTILRMNLDGSGLEVYAWGLRNPFGVIWGPDGKLYASDNGFDERGSRPIANAPDVVWELKQGAWYGWPDYAGGEPVTKPQFQSERGPAPRFLMKEHPEVPRPLAALGLHCGAAKMDVSRNGGDFGHEGHLVLALFGDLRPMTGTEEGRAGFKVVHIDAKTGAVHDRFRARTEGKLPVEVFRTKEPRRPIDVRFAPRGDALYVVDFGALAVIETAAGPQPRLVPGSGSVWRITRRGAVPRPLGGTPRT